MTPNNKNAGSNIGFQASLKRLKIAKATALSKSKKKSTLESAEDLSSRIDDKIKSLALNKFVVRKAKRLKALGETKEKTAQLVAELQASQDSILSRSANALKGFGIDQKFLGLSAEEILQKVNAVPKSGEEPKSGKTRETKTKETSDGKMDVTTNITIMGPADSSGNLTQGLSNPNFSKKDSALKVPSNPDTDTVQDIEQNNEKIYDYLIKSGELDIANHVLETMKKNGPKEKASVSDVKANTKQLTKLSEVNEDIYEKLDFLADSLKEGQETDIDIRKKLKENAKIEREPKNIEEEKQSSGFIEAILNMIFGGGIVRLLKSAGGSVLKLGKALISSSWKWLTGKITGLVGPMLSGIKNWVSSKLGILKSALTSLGRTLTSKIAKVSGAVASSAKNAWKATQKKLGLSRGKDNVKGVKDSRSPKSSKTKPTRTSRVGRGGRGGRAGRGAAKIKGGVKLSVSRMTKAVPTGILKKLTKFTKFIPGLGTAIAAGTAIYSAQDGYRNADEILGKEPKDLTMTDKLASAAGALVNDVSFGMLSTRGTARKIIDWTKPSEGQKVVDEAIENGVIGTNSGRGPRYEVKNWTLLGAMPSEKIKHLIDAGGFKSADLKKMQELYEKRKKFEGSGESYEDAETPSKTESGAPEISGPQRGSRDESQDKIAALQEKINSIQSAKSKAEQAGNQSIANSSQEWIKIYEESIRNLRAKGSIGSDSVLTREDAQKERQMRNSENVYRSGLENTKSYDQKSTRSAPRENSINSINAMQVPPQSENRRPSEIFQW